MRRDAGNFAKLADLRSRCFWFVDKDAVRINVSPISTNADMTILIQRASYHLFGEYYPIPRKAERMLLYRLARDRAAILIMTTCIWIP